MDRRLSGRGALLAALLLTGACGGHRAAPGVPSAVTVDVPAVAAPAEPATSEPASGVASEDTHADAPPVLTPFETALSDWTGRSQCSGFDYGPNGGIQTLWCHRPRSVDLALLAKAAGGPIFTSGPHRPDALTLDSADDFGHYQPAYVRWLSEGLLASVKHDSPGQKATAAAYERAARPLAEILWLTHVKLTKDVACYRREKTLYEDAIRRKKLPRGYYERWFYFMNPYFCERAARGDKDTSFYFENGFDAGVNGNVTKSAVGFWLRRNLDGTALDFAQALQKLLAAYQPELLAQTWQPLDTAATTKALATAVSSATSGCKDPSATVARIHVTVVFAPEGSVRKISVAPQVAQGSSAAACVQDRFASLQVPPFTAPDMSFSRSIPVR